MNTENFNEYLATLRANRRHLAALRANRRANDFLSYCTTLYKVREVGHPAWLVDAAVQAYMPELRGKTLTEAKLWPLLRDTALEDLKRAYLQAWSVRNSCPIDHLDSYEFEQADYVIITEPLNRGELPLFEQYVLPVNHPWEFVGVRPEGVHALPPKPSWWNHPRQYWKQTSGWHDGRPNYEPAVSVRPSYDISLMEVRSDLQRLGLPLEARKTNVEGLFEIIWDRTYEPLPAVLKDCSCCDWSYA